MRVKVYFQMSINLYNAEIEEEKHLITLGHHTGATPANSLLLIRFQCIDDLFLISISLIPLIDAMEKLPTALFTIKFPVGTPRSFTFHG